MQDAIRTGFALIFQVMKMVILGDMVMESRNVPLDVGVAAWTMQKMGLDSLFLLHLPHRSIYHPCK